MPARVIRGEINASESLTRVSMFADLTFRALLVAVDDWGRIDGRLPALKASLFPMRDEVTLRKLDGWLDELAAGPSAPILRYVVDGRPFIQLVGWERHRGKGRRASSSKWPAPLPRKSEDLPEILGSLGNPPEGRGTRDENREAGVSPSAPAAAAPPAPARSQAKASRKTSVPAQLSPEDRARVLAWAAKQSPPITEHALGYAWRVFTAKARASRYVYADHAQAFMNAIGAAGKPWALKDYEPPSSTGGSRYRDADQVLAEARRKQAEDDARARGDEDPQQVAKVIELSLRQAGGGGREIPGRPRRHGSLSQGSGPGDGPARDAGRAAGPLLCGPVFKQEVSPQGPSDRPARSSG